MFQKDNLFDWLTVWENVTLGLKIKKCMNRINLIKVENLLRSYQLYDFKDSYPRELSGGMRQRVALIRTLALSPELLILDEPATGLDYNITKELYKILEILNKENNMTIIMATHDLDEINEIKPRIIYLAKTVKYDGELEGWKGF